MRKWTLLALLPILLLPSLAFAQIDAGDTGVEDTGDFVYGPLDGDLGYYVGTRIVQPILALVGLLFLLMVIYAGFLWMTDMGNQKSAQKAKSILVYSTIGIVVIVIAYAITGLVLDIATGNIG